MAPSAPASRGRHEKWGTLAPKSRFLARLFLRIGNLRARNDKSDAAVAGYAEEIKIILIFFRNLIGGSGLWPSENEIPDLSALKGSGASS
jgi:hypothetical protein